MTTYATSTARSATDKQLSFIRNLLAERVGNDAAESIREGLNEARVTGLLCTRTASAAIESLLRIPKATASTPAAPAVQLEDGIYRADDGEIVKVYHTVHGRNVQVGKRLSVRDNGDGTFTGEFVYVGKAALVGLTSEHKLSHEAAAEFGKIYGSLHYGRLRSGQEFPGPAKRRQGVARGRVCYVDGCDKPVRCVGLCNAHYKVGRQRDACPGCGGPKSEKARECAGCFRALPAATEKLCLGCGETKPLNAFSLRNSPAGPRPRARCRTCDKTAARAWSQAKGREYLRRKKAESSAKMRRDRPEAWATACLRRSAKDLGVDLGLVLDRLEACGGLCEICGRLPVGRSRLSIDHDHASGAFRGLLCGPCNSAVGLLGDDPDRMMAAAAYLTRVDV